MGICRGPAFGAPMAGLAALVLTALWLLLPAYLANMMPVLVGGGAPIDGKRNWRDGRRMLGDGKTWRGFLLAPPLAAALFLVLDQFVMRGVGPFPHFAATPAWTFAFACAMGYGALVGDLTESFFKRRLGKERGERWLGFDQLDFVVGAWVVGILVSAALMPFYGAFWFAATFVWGVILVQLVLTPALHLLVNFLGFKLGLKEVPW